MSGTGKTKITWLVFKWDISEIRTSTLTYNSIKFVNFIKGDRPSTKIVQI